MRLSVPIYHLKKQAKARARTEGVPLHQALDLLAQQEGYKSWSHLSALHARENPAQTVYSGFDPGDLILLAARPGEGKTLMGLELAMEAYRRGRQSLFFTLDCTEKDVRACFAALGIAEDAAAGSVEIDTSDEICADYIAARLSRSEGSYFAVVDYLQLLDQKRSHPAMDVQLCALRQCARATGAIVVILSQIDRRFDAVGRDLPDWGDLRLPNPVDLTQVSKACFLHKGRLALRRAA